MSKRLMVNMDDKTAELIKKFAENRGVSMSNMVNHLIEDSIELQEDYYLSDLVKNVDYSKTIPASEVWEECGL